jgi:hypothetical protein
MATYVNDLRLKEITTGDESGTWGTSTNTNLELIAEAFSYGTEVITTNADTHTTTIADGATDPGRALYLKYTGTLDSACTITIGPNTVSKVWIVENGTSGSQNIILSQGSGANITIPAGDTKVVYSDGAGAGAAFVDAFASLSVVDLKVQDDLTVTDDLIVNGDIDLEGNMDVNGSLETDALSLNGTTVTSTAAEINLLDGSSANTVVNSKAVIYGSSGEVAGTLSTAAQPNITSVGTLTGLTTTGDINFGDDDKAIFGAGSDLQIYHDGSNSYIVDNGTGDLLIRAENNLYLKRTNSDETYLSGTVNDAVTLYHNNNAKLATTLTGIDVTGTATMDGLTVDGNAVVQSAEPRFILGETDVTDQNTRFRNTGGDLQIQTIDDAYTVATNRISLDHATGDISFYDDTGVSQALFWDASAESLGIGTTSPAFGAISTGIEVEGTTAGIRLQGATTGALEVYHNNGLATIDSRVATGGSKLAFNTEGTERLRIDSSGNVGIGTSSPTSLLTVGSGGTANPASTVAIHNTAADEYRLKLTSASFNADGKWLGLGFGYSDNYMKAAIIAEAKDSNARTNLHFCLDGNANDNNAALADSKMTITYGGNVGIGTDSPSEDLHVSGTGDRNIAVESTNTGAGANAGIKILAADGGDFLLQTGNATGNALRLYDLNATAERMRIDSSGNTLFGCTALPSGGAGGAAFETGQSSGRSILQLGTTSTFALRLANFYNGNGNVGNIIVSGSATAFNTSSDARLKDVTGKARGLEVINQLNPVSYNWKVDGKADEGLIAQEVLDIVPNAVSGSEEEKYYMDYSKLVVHLVAGIKEQQALIESLTARITTLEG